MSRSRRVTATWRDPSPPRWYARCGQCARHRCTVVARRVTGRDRMPRFMDFHEDLQLPQEAINEIAQGTRAGATHEFGVRQIELYPNAHGNAYSLLDGPHDQPIPHPHTPLA